MTLLSILGGNNIKKTEDIIIIIDDQMNFESLIDNFTFQVLDLTITASTHTLMDDFLYGGKVPMQLKGTNSMP